MTDNPKRPLETLRDGALKATIWENSRDGKTSHSVQYRRTYRDQDGQLRESDSFFQLDQLRLGHLTGQVYDRLAKLREQSRGQQEPKRSRSRERDQDRER